MLVYGFGITGCTQTTCALWHGLTPDDRESLVIDTKNEKARKGLVKVPSNLNFDLENCAKTSGHNKSIAIVFEAYISQLNFIQHYI